MSYFYTIFKRFAGEFDSFAAGFIAICSEEVRNVVPRTKTWEQHKEFEKTLVRVHRLDCAFFNLAIELIFQAQPTDSIRAAFIEEERLFSSSAIFELADIQIAMSNPNLIIESHISKI